MKIKHAIYDEWGQVTGVREVADISLQRQLERSLERVQSTRRELEDMAREVGLEKRWKTATVVGLDGYQEEGELVVEIGFQTRTDQRSGEKFHVGWEGLLAIMDKLGVKKMSELIGKACIICVEMDGKTVVAVEHFFAKNPVSDNG